MKVQASGYDCHCSGHGSHTGGDMKISPGTLSEVETIQKKGSAKAAAATKPPR